MQNAKCESENLVTCKVQNKMRKHFIADKLWQEYDNGTAIKHDLTSTNIH